MIDIFKKLLKMSLNTPFYGIYIISAYIIATFKSVQCKVKWHRNLIWIFTTFIFEFIIIHSKMSIFIRPGYNYFIFLYIIIQINKNFGESWIIFIYRAYLKGMNKFEINFMNGSSIMIFIIKKLFLWLYIQPQ